MTDLVTRLRAFADDHVGKADRAACIETEAADAIETAARERDAMRDSNDGLTEDLYQAVLEAYRRGAVEWTMLNYPQWINAISAGQEVAPVARQTLNQEQPA